jgi:predicted transcriptional regulator
MKKDEILRSFWLHLINGKDDKVITAWKERDGYCVVVCDISGNAAEICWQDLQRVPFWKSQAKLISTFRALKARFPELTEERFHEIANEFANADRDGDIKDYTEHTRGTEVSKEPPRIEARDKYGQPIPREILDAQAMEFLHDPALLYRVKTLLEKGFQVDRYRFVLGEDDKKLLTFLIGISAQTPWPQNEWWTGSSGFGKTNVVITTLALMPPGYVKQRSYLTPGGLRYGSQNYKVLFLKEWRYSSEQDFRLTSKEDGGYIYEIAVRDPETGEMTTQVGEIPAKTIITTSAERLPSEQMLRRCWLLSADESDELTERVNKRKAEYAAGKVEPASQAEVAVVQRAIQLLQPVDVVIPYAEELVNIAPWDRTRLDFLFDIIRVIAYLYQYQRPKDSQNRIVATPADLYIALRVAWPTFMKTLCQLPDRLRRVLERLPREEDENGKSAKELASELGLSQSTVRGYLADLVNLGYAYEEKIPGQHGKRYWASSRSAELLNTAESIIQQLNWQKIADFAKKAAITPPPGSVESEQGYDAITGVVDPLTGEEVSLLPPSQNSTLSKGDEIGQISQKEAKIGEFSAENKSSAQFSSSAVPPSFSSQSLSTHEKKQLVTPALEEILLALHLINGCIEKDIYLDEAERAGIRKNRACQLLEEKLSRGELMRLSSERFAFIGSPSPSLVPVRFKVDTPQIVDFGEGSVVNRGPYRRGQLGVISLSLANVFEKKGIAERVRRSESNG